MIQLQYINVTNRMKDLNAYRKTKSKNTGTKTEILKQTRTFNAST